MSTQFYTQDQPTTSQPDTGRRAPARKVAGMGPQTVAAIKDLQRQASLPQTGTMNAATQAALANYLAHGNNQMAG
jgi:peptidoglycan hydrolase-like protein with peptidoglycan-binding domain